MWKFSSTNINSLYNKLKTILYLTSFKILTTFSKVKPNWENIFDFVYGSHLVLVINKFVYQELDAWHDILSMHPSTLEVYIGSDINGQPDPTKYPTNPNPTRYPNGENRTTRTRPDSELPNPNPTRHEVSN